MPKRRCRECGGRLAIAEWHTVCGACRVLNTRRLARALAAEGVSWNYDAIEEEEGPPRGQGKDMPSEEEIWSLAPKLRAERPELVKDRAGHSQSALTFEEVLDIYDQKRFGSGVIPALCMRYGVTKGAVYSIWRGKTWARVTGAKVA